MTQSTAVAVSSRYNDADINQEIAILDSAFPKLDATTSQKKALIVAAKFSGLNPFRGEIYFLPKVGIQVASKIKAADAISYQAMRGNTLNIRFVRVTAEMCKMPNSPYANLSNIQPNDVVSACHIISSHQRRDYFAYRMQLAEEGRAYRYVGRELEQWVNEKAGPAPEIVGMGVVRAGENFGGDTRYSREDRAEKRALMMALNKGGYAAPDTRNYGGVTIPDEPPQHPDADAIDTQYQVIEPGVSGTADAAEIAADLVATKPAPADVGSVATATDSSGAIINGQHRAARNEITNAIAETRTSNNAKVIEARKAAIAAFNKRDATLDELRTAADGITAAMQTA